MTDYEDVMCDLQEMGLHGDVPTKFLPSVAKAIDACRIAIAVEWQPIETAPQGIWILIFGEYNYVWQACWFEADKCWCTEGKMLIRSPTHWMHLPEGPQSHIAKEMDDAK